MCVCVSVHVSTVLKAEFRAVFFSCADVRGGAVQEEAH